MTNLKDFCNGQFWNSNLTWYTENPRFTRCFEKTVLTLFPALVFWMFVPLESYFIRVRRKRTIPWNWKNVVKIAIVTGITILVFCELCTNLKGDKVDVYIPPIRMATFICVGYFIYRNKLRGQRASGHQYMFWLLTVVCGIPQLMSDLQDIQKRMAASFLFLLTYNLSLTMLVLNCIADDAPEATYHTYKAHPNPIDGTSFPGRIFYTFYDKLLYKGFRTKLEQSDMWDLEFECEAGNLAPEFERRLQRKSRNPLIRKLKIENKRKPSRHKSKEVSVLWIIFVSFYPRFIVGAACRLLVVFLSFVNPQILRLLIISKQPLWQGIFYACSMFTVGVIQTIIHNIHFTNLWYFGLKARSALLSCIYRKSLRICNKVRNGKTSAEIVNLMAVDAERFPEFGLALPLIWLAPLDIVLSIYFLWREVGVATFAGLGLIILLIPVSYSIVSKTKQLQVAQMKFKDERVKIVGEILSGIKFLKLYAWEPSFEKLVERIRSKEVVNLLKAAYLSACCQFIWNCAPFAVALVIFATYVLMDEGHVLNAPKAFMSLALLNVLRQPLVNIPNVINIAVQNMVSLERISSFLNAEELEEYVEHTPNKEYAILVSHGTFSWGHENVLKDIDFTVPKHSLTAIVGPVGCGKSSLINAILGQMDRVSGKVNTLGRIAYVSQQAWIQNATARDNIIFDNVFDKKWYKKVVMVCALKKDFDAMPYGDRTEIGEKGVNLSGGQKQRISLARAIYDCADIYLFDDPLSAVDGHVSQHIFVHLIGPMGVLRDKTRVLVTHSVTYLPQVDNIYVLDKGRVREQGSYVQLMSLKGAFAEFMWQYINNRVEDAAELDKLEKQVEDTALGVIFRQRISKKRSEILESKSKEVIVEQLSSEEETGSVDSSSEVVNVVDDGEIGLEPRKQLIEREYTEKGGVKLAVYLYYLKAVGYVATIATVLFYVGFQICGIGSNIWLGHWTESAEGNTKYLSVYAAFGFCQGLCILTANLVFARGKTKAAARLHNTLMHTILRLPMKFFEATPYGRIIARLSGDIIGVDLRLPNYFTNVLFTGLSVIGVLGVVCFATPLFIAALVPMGVIYLLVQRYFAATIRQVKRLESVSKAPVYSHFCETLSGTHIIRAYECQDQFVKESEERIDAHQRCTLVAIFASRWLSVRLEILGNVIILASALLAVTSNINDSILGLSISYALQSTQLLNLLVRAMSDAETSIVSVERIRQYTSEQQEKPWTIPSTIPPSYWPDNGQVEFHSLSATYREGLEPVLKKIDFAIKPGEKIGIVGRTGAGKSSLALCLMRILEASEGEIMIDGINIAEIGLHDLRSKLTIIPQDAMLFSGTLRFNLDPFDQFGDGDLWQVIEQAHLKNLVESFPSGLDQVISEEGQNMSVGQRHMICLARALLRKTKILILDEATAAVDLETDALIQSTIRREFEECTVITIAHRLESMMDLDKVLVLRRGRVVEFDDPQVLMTDSETVFSSMCRDAGINK